jgi:archaellum component FlaC
MAVMARETWTDERLDDLKEQMNNGFGEVKGEIREVKGEIREVKREIRSLRSEVKTDIGRLDAKIDRLTLTLVAALIGMAVTHYLG